MLLIISQCCISYINQKLRMTTMEKRPPRARKALECHKTVISGLRAKSRSWHFPHTKQAEKQHSGSNLGCMLRGTVMILGAFNCVIFSSVAAKGKYDFVL
jgi:hypothetical protein